MANDVPVVSVHFYGGPERGWFMRALLDDDAFLERVDAYFSDIPSPYAVWSDGEMWCLLSKRTGDCDRYPNREAAEMVAIHRG